MAYTDSHRPQVQADQEEALQVLDLKLGARTMYAAVSDIFVSDSEILTCLIDEPSFHAIPYNEHN